MRGSQFRKALTVVPWLEVFLICISLSDRSVFGTPVSPIGVFNHNNGDHPKGLIIDSSGNLYGSTTVGGISDLGIVFKVSAGTNVITVLGKYDITTGQGTSAVTRDLAGNLFVTTTSTQFTPHNGAICTVNGASVLPKLFFDGTNGGATAGFLVDSNGDLYGASEAQVWYRYSTNP